MPSLPNAALEIRVVAVPTSKDEPWILLTCIKTTATVVAEISLPDDSNTCQVCLPTLRTFRPTRLLLEGIQDIDALHLLSLLAADVGESVRDLSIMNLDASNVSDVQNVITKFDKTGDSVTRLHLSTMFPLTHTVSLATCLGSLAYLRLDLREEMVPEFFQNDDNGKQQIGLSLGALSSLSSLETLDIRISHDLQMNRYFDLDSHVVMGFAHGYACIPSLQRISSHVLPSEPRAFLDMMSQLPNLVNISRLSFGAHRLWQEANAADGHDKLEKLSIHVLKIKERELLSLVSACNGLFSALTELELHVHSICCDVADMVRILSSLADHPSLKVVKCGWGDELEETSGEFATLYREELEGERIELVEIPYSD